MKNLKSRLIFTMFDALYTKGYYASNLKEILEDANTSKGGMYHHFDSKKALTIAAIDLVLTEYINRVWVKPLSESENPLQTLYETINMLSCADIYDDYPVDFKYGCPINNLVQELSAADAEIAQRLDGVLNLWEESIVKTLTRVRKNLRIDVSVHESASFIIASIEGCYSYAKLHQSKASFDKLSLQVIEYIKSLVRN